MEIYEMQKLSEGLNFDAHYTTWTTELILIKDFEFNKTPNMQQHEQVILKMISALSIGQLNELQPYISLKYMT